MKKVRLDLYVEENNFIQVHKFVASIGGVTKLVNCKQIAQSKFVENRYIFYQKQITYRL